MANWLGGRVVVFLVLVMVVVGSLLDEQSDVSTVAQPESEKCCSI
jgi:hypothetical protein